MSAPRPRAVTLACIYAGLAGAILFVSFIDLATGWNSLEVQQRIQDLVDVGGFGESFDLDTMMPVVRIAASIGSILAMAVIVFSIFAARGDRSSRWGITVLTSLALIFFIAGGIAGLIPAVLSVMVLSFLWSKPSREWFAAVNSNEPVELVSAGGGAHRSATKSHDAGTGTADSAPWRPGSRIAGTHSDSTSQSPTQAPGKPGSAGGAGAPAPLKSPSEHFGDQATAGPDSDSSDTPAQQPPAPGAADPYRSPTSNESMGGPAFPGVLPAAPLSAQPVPASAGPMPTLLKVGLSLIGVGAMISLGISALMLLMTTGMRDALIEELQNTPELVEQFEATGFSENDLLTIMAVLAGLWLAAAVFALLTVALTFTRKKYAWWLLLLGLVGPLVLSILAVPLGLISAVPIVAVIVIILRAEVRAWFM